MRRLIRFIDWRLIVSITVLLVVVSAIHSSLATAQDRDRLAAEAIRKDRIAAAERKDASAERARILEGQRRLEDKYDALLGTQRRIVSYVNGRGIFIPESVFDGSSGTADDSDNDNGDGSGSHSSSSTDGSGKQLPPKSGSTSNDNGSSSGGSGKGHGTGGRHDEGHGSPSSKGHSEGKAKGHGKANGKVHKR